MAKCPPAAAACDNTVETWRPKQKVMGAQYLVTAAFGLGGEKGTSGLFSTYWLWLTVGNVH